MARKFLLVCILLCITLPAVAEDPPAELNIHKFQLGDITYVGFLTKDAQTLLQYRIDIPKLKIQIAAQKEKIENKQLQIDTLASANSTLLEIKEFMIVENVRLQKEIDKQNAWYHSPYFAFALGFVIGTATAIATVYLIK